LLRSSDELIEPTASLKRSVEEALGQPVAVWHCPELGLSAAQRFSVELTDGSRLFVKAAVDADTERWLRTEFAALEAVRAPYQPSLRAFLEPDNGFPVLITEDFSHAYWPASHAGVTWREGDIDRVLAAVKEMASTRPSSDLPALGAEAPTGYWPALMANPVEFLKLGLCDAAWLDLHGNELVRAESTLSRSGDALVHGDVRSDNICLLPDRVVFVDWSNAGRGSPDTDLAELLPTLHLEGGPRPYELMPTGASWAAWQAGYLASRALGGRLYEGRDQAAPAWLIRVLVRLARINLVWAAECLGVPLPVSERMA
jgi:hypothetical protein